MVDINALKDERNNILAWFKEYDIQVQQYLRDIRINHSSSIDISSLDAQAVQKAQRMREIVSEIDEYYASKG